MRVTIHAEPAAFYSRVEPLLLAHEAEHNLHFSILHGARTAPPEQAPPLMATVEAGGEVVGVALRVEPHPLVLSRGITGKAALALARALSEQGIELSGVLGLTDWRARLCGSMAGGDWARI